MLVSDCDAPAAARLVVREISEGFDEECIEVARLLITEIVTNAVRHAGGDEIEVSLWIRDGTLDVLVTDGGSGFNAAAPLLNSADSGGRGLQLVDTLSLSWGSSSEHLGVVWFQVALRPAAVA